MLITAFVLGLCYTCLLAWFTYGWQRLPYFDATSTPVREEGDSEPFFTIIIPARNEAANIEQCLKGIMQQTLPVKQWECIVVDDHSGDETAAIVRQVQADNPQIPLRITEAPSADNLEFVAYKKQAIEQGIRQANGEWIVTTDADCIAPTQWLWTLKAFIDEKRPYLVAGPVSFLTEDSVFKCMQALEFMSLIGIGAASVSNNAPNMCNGANLAYKKRVFEEDGHSRAPDEPSFSKKTSGFWRITVSFFVDNALFLAFPPQNSVLFPKNRTLRACHLFG